MGNWSRRRSSPRSWIDVAKVVGVSALGVVAVGMSVALLARYYAPNPQDPYVAATFAASSPTASCTPGDASMSRAAQIFADDPSGLRLAVLGDSTRDESAAAPALFAALRKDLSGADVASFGRNGFPLSRYAEETDIAEALSAYNPTAIELSIGINDFRLGRGDEAAFTETLVSYVQGLREDFPSADVMISIPAALSTQNVGDADYLEGPNGEVNPDGMADDVTKTLRAAYLNASAQLPGVALLDVQQQITGTDADPSAVPKFLRDQIHPDEETASEVAALIASRIGGTCS